MHLELTAMGIDIIEVEGGTAPSSRGEQGFLTH